MFQRLNVNSGLVNKQLFSFSLQNSDRLGNYVAITIHSVQKISSQGNKCNNWTNTKKSCLRLYDIDYDQVCTILPLLMSHHPFRTLKISMKCPNMKILWFLSYTHELESIENNRNENTSNTHLFKQQALSLRMKMHKHDEMDQVKIHKLYIVAQTKYTDLSRYTLKVKIIKYNPMLSLTYVAPMPDHRDFPSYFSITLIWRT